MALFGGGEYAIEQKETGEKHSKAYERQIKAEQKREKAEAKRQRKEQKRQEKLEERARKAQENRSQADLSASLARKREQRKRAVRALLPGKAKVNRKAKRKYRIW